MRILNLVCSDLFLELLNVLVVLDKAVCFVDLNHEFHVLMEVLIGKGGVAQDYWVGERVFIFMVCNDAR